MSPNQKNRIAPVMAGVLFVSLTHTRAAVIDTFGTPVGGHTISIITGVVGTSTSSTEGGLAVLGGSREIYLVVDNTYAVGNQTSSSANNTTSPDFLTYANDANVDTTLRLTWDALGGGLNTNLSKETGFQLLNLFSDSPCNYTIGLQTFGGGSSTQLISTGGFFSGNIDFSMAGFTGGANLADIDRITLTISGGRSADVSLHAFVTVPEPGTSLLGGIGVLAFLCRRRR